jgi:ferredoxin
MADIPNTRDFKVVVDSELCSAHGRCYSLAPAVFQPDAEGFSVVKVEAVPASERELLERVVQLCPELAIRIEELSDTDGGAAQSAP